MTNPLVAQAQDSTKPYTGISLMESAADLKSAIESGDWASVAMGAVGTALDALSMAMDPFGAILAAGVAWLMEHVGPLKQALDGLTGNADEIAAQSETWKNIAGELQGVGTDLGDMVKADLQSWTGPAADAYRQRTEDAVALLGSAQKGCEGASSGVKTAGEVVAAVRALVRDIIAELIGHLISWALQVVFTLGIGLTWVVPQVIGAVAKTASKIADLVKRLVTALKALIPLLKRAGDLFSDAAKALKGLKNGSKVAPPKKVGGIDGTPKAPPAKGGGSTTPSGDHSPPPKGGDSTTPSGDHSPPPPKGGDSTTPSGDHTPPPKNDTPDGGPNGTPPPAKGPGGDSTTSSGAKGDIRGGNGNPPHNSTPTKDLPDCGDPIDVASGRMFLPQTDVELRAALPLIVSRTHLSDYRVGRSFGRTWASTLDQRLEIDDEGVSFAAEDGALMVYPLPGDSGSVLPEFGPRWPLARTADGGFTVTMPELSQTLLFAPAGGAERPVTAVLRGSGPRIDFGRDEHGVLTTISHSGGYLLNVETTAGLVTALDLVGGARLPDGTPADLPLVRYRYDDARRLVEVVNSSGRPLRFGYDADGRITSWEDRNGFSYRYRYDEAGRCVRTEGDGGYLDYTFDYDPAARVTRATNSLGAVITYHFTEWGQVAREIDPLGHEVRYDWDRHHRLLVRTDELGGATTYTYDEAGDLVGVGYPDGTADSARYDERHRPVLTVDVDGARTEREYGERGELTAVVDAAGARTTYGYDAAGNLATIVDPLGGRTTIVSDVRGLTQSVTGPTGAAGTFEYDAFGRLAAETSPAGETTRYAWTIEGRPLRMTGPGGGTEQWTYDGEGNLREHRDATGARTLTEVGGFDLPSARIAPDGSRMEFTHDTELRLVAVRNEQGRRWDYRHDAAGNLVEESDFDGRVLRYTYNAAGDLTSRTNGAGETLAFTRDALGRVVEQRAGEEVTRWTYDAAGRLLRTVNADADVTFTYDAMGRTLTETCNGRTVRSEYDALGRRTRRTLPSGLVSQWAYDGAGAPVGLQVGGHTMSLRRDAAGRVVQRGWGVTDTRQHWDAAGRLAAQTVASAGGALVHRRAYDYREDGLLTAMHDAAAGTRAFELDPVGRISAVTGAHAERYSYDSTGNVTGAQAGTVPDPLAGPRTYAGTRITGAGATRYAHDQQGRLVERVAPGLDGRPQVWRFTWNAEDRLTGVTTPDGQRWRYRYDPLGRRVAKQRLAADGTVAEQVDFTWDGAALAEEHQLTPARQRRLRSWDVEPGSALPLLQSERLLGPDGVQQVVDQRFYAIMTDVVGTPTELIGLDGVVVRQQSQTIWGRPLDNAPAVTPLRFPGQYFDAETGLHYNYHRYFDPGTARFLSADPLGLGGGPNPQAYVANPLAFIDPSGLTPCSDAAASGSGGGGSSRGGGGNPGGRGGNGRGGNGNGGGSGGPSRPPRNGNRPPPPYYDNPLPTTPHATVPHTPDNPNGSLYHYTNEAGMNGIMGSGHVRPSAWTHGTPDNPLVGSHARYGSGGYFTNIAPGQLSQEGLSQALVLNPGSGASFTHHIEVSPSALESQGYTISQSDHRPDVYVVHHNDQPTNHPNPRPVEIGDSHVSHGPNPQGPHLGDSMGQEDWGDAARPRPPRQR
ncbi:RHS repeat-associated core domain-containing protein [Amycolatopsis sp. NPDC088138]|uniref:RHS repeat-associated core domain-containing protein n=1 Tax=Amycolatopsis sp. NPDC088138 TaxID=3363938 RepID=UPI00381D0192